MKNRLTPETATPFWRAGAPCPLAFSLIELLAAIAIISILIALAFGGISKVKESAKKTTCIANLRALHQGLIAYAGDNDGKIPYDSSNVAGGSQMWHRKIGPYIGGPEFDDWISPSPKLIRAYRCPSDEKPSLGYFSYGLNVRLAGLRLQGIQSGVICFAEATSLQVAATGSNISTLKPNHHGEGTAIKIDGSMFPFKETLPPPSEQPSLWIP